MGVVIMSQTNAWGADLLPIVFTRLKNGLSNDTKTFYGITNKNFSTVANSTTQTVFPFICVRSVAPRETMQTISNNEIAGITLTIQIDVITNTTQSDADNIAYELLDIMKQMKFNVSSMPSFESNIDEYRSTARYTRLIGASETL